VTAALPVCSQCTNTIRVGDLVDYTNTGDMVHRDCHPNLDVVDTCPDCNLALEWSKFGYWTHPDTGTVACPGEPPKPERHLHLVRSPQPMTPPTHCGCGNPTDGTSTCRDCVKGYE
jgi:hypothetical protein